MKICVYNIYIHTHTHTHTHTPDTSWYKLYVWLWTPVCSMEIFFNQFSQGAVLSLLSARLIELRVMCSINKSENIRKQIWKILVFVEYPKKKKKRRKKRNTAVDAVRMFKYGQPSHHFFGKLNFIFTICSPHFFFDGVVLEMYCGSQTLVIPVQEGFNCNSLVTTLCVRCS